MLYTQSKQPFSEDKFRSPESCYRGTPFWSWNTLMTKEMIDKQISEFKKMGMGGFHIHVRVGLENQYLSDEFMELVHFCNEKAKENGMLCWLYDEDRYSSGFAGGEVTKTIAYRAKWLKLSVNRDENMLETHDDLTEKLKNNEKVRGCYLMAYDIELEDGFIKNARVVEKDDIANGVKWYLYIEFAEESPWCNNQTYVDTMMPEAIGEFIRLTHERYAEVIQDDFGKSVPAIFTDEPHINGLRLPAKADGQGDILLPYTESLPDEFGTVAGKDLFAAIPYVIWSRKGEIACKERYHYFRTIGRMFANAFCKQIGDWCGRHNLMSSGHLLGEDSLRGQASTVGDAMQCYREFQLPGIDNLCDNRDFSAAKQASSIVHQYKKEGVLSELYGVTQWDFDFKGYKLAGDWQAALGITVRVPHLAWASMNGEAKRDYPAAIGWQSPWYLDYSYIENHYARLNYCLTRGKALVHVGVLHTVESFWLLQGPANQTEDSKKQLENDFQSLTEWLLTGGIDFDYISESSLEDDGFIGDDGALCCGDMSYKAILVPSCICIRESTLSRLLQFAEAGGTVLFIGDTPQYVDCHKNTKLDDLVMSCSHVSLNKQAVLDILNPWREIDLLDNGRKRTSNLLHQMRYDDENRWLFIAQAYKGMKARQEEVWYRRALYAPQKVEIRIKGHWDVTYYNTLTGENVHLNAMHKGNLTVINYDLYGNDSLLLRLAPCKAAMTDCCNQLPSCSQKRLGNLYTLPEPEAYIMSEPNALLLDHFEYALDDEDYHAPCEMLRLDNQLRHRLHLPLRCESLAQPYIRMKDDSHVHRVRLKTEFHSNVSIAGCLLAFEKPFNCCGRLNGQPIGMEACGYYVDPAITTVVLPSIQSGKNVLELSLDYSDSTNLEWMYILGDFGVELKGAHTCIIKKPDKLFWGDYTRQGFPFYTGNMTYLVNIPNEFLSDKESCLQVPYYSGAAVKVCVDNEAEEMLAFVPHECKLKSHTNKLKLTCLGNRYNGFGQLHLIGDDLLWLGANSWRTEGTSWTETYQVKPMGILSAPIIKTE